MNVICVEASKKYNVLIENNLLDKAGEIAIECGLRGKACVISDTNVAPLYIERVRKALENAGLEIFEYVFESGEKSKNAGHFIEILNFLAKNHFTRTDSVFALGGGVTGDLAGFSAASYMRGINFVQIPTSLLAMVDSSVGGKTAIDLEAGKNLAGAFYQPRFVLIDPMVLSTLPEKFLNDAMAEIIKYAMITKNNLPKLLEENDIEEIIAECIRIKSDIVHKDEFEGGIRRLLNFGHTVGHAVEALSNFNITHGNAVAIGMYVITKAWERRGLCKKGTVNYLEEVLEKYSLPQTCDYSSENLRDVCSSDKKMEGSTLNLVVPIEIGRCEVLKVDMDELENILKEGMAE